MRRLPLVLPLLFLAATACTSGLKGRRTEPRFRPEDKPPFSEDALRDALDEYAIDLPSGVDFPRLDAQLKDRGSTSWTPFTGNTEVTLGPTAFGSWALLGSTLAHEIEIHCRQSLLLISFQESVGVDAKTKAERQAYLYELEQAKRFGLTAAEVERIAQTLAVIDER